MMTVLGSRVQAIRPSLMFEILDRAKELEKEGHQVIHLEKGEPELGTPSFISNAGKEALDQGFDTELPS